MKLRKLHIEDYKMFKDFDISFVDENDEALPIVVLAGVNGSGKTSLLEFIYNFSNLERKDKSTLEIYINEEIRPVDKKSNKFTLYFNEYTLEGNELLYLSVNRDMKHIKDFLPKKIENMVYKEEIPPREAYIQIREYIDDILKSLNPEIEFNGRDGEGNLFFRNKSGGDKFSIDELSTGEKTLMSKVLYLYLKNIKDKVILIDEPELSLHPSWQNKVLKIYENFALKNNCQIIIATHSPHIIASAKNEYLRILRKNEEGNVEVVSGLKAHGRDINSILFDVMGEVAYRPREFDDKIDRLHIAIDDRKIEEAQKRLEELKKDYGEDDEVVMEAQMLIDMFRRDDKEL